MSLFGNVSLTNANGKEIRTRNPRNTLIMVAHESKINEKINFHKVDPERITKGRNNDLCIFLNDLEPEKRYVTSIQASNEYGASEPSSPLFITTGKAKYSPSSKPK